MPCAPDARHALKRRSPRTRLIPMLVVLGSLGLGGWPSAGVAERADRQLPMTIEADRSSTVDLGRRIVRFEGRVVLTQGSLRLTADRMEVSELGSGHRRAQAQGLPDQPATFRDKRDGLDEFIEGRAMSIDYDSRQELIRLEGKAVVRRLRGTQLADEVVGEIITWDGAREFFSVLPGASTEGAGARVRAVLTPPPAASAPAAPNPSAPRR